MLNSESVGLLMLNIHKNVNKVNLIFQVCGAFRTMITVPEAAWDQFISTVDQATVKCDPDMETTPTPVDS